MTETAAALAAPGARPRAWWRSLTRGPGPWTAAFLRLAARIGTGSLAVTLPDGRTVRFGRVGDGPAADLTLHDAAAARRLVLGGPVAFAEAYVDGLWDSADLTALLELAVANRDRTGLDRTGLGAFRLLRRLRHRGRANTRRGSRRNVAFHYDLGNDFYRLWLDEGMTYSSGLYADGARTLAEAQAAKLRRVAALLDVAPGMRVLEIGCGWGSLAEHLARDHGARVTGITLSREQLAWGRRRLGPAAELRLMDYRAVEGTWDRVVSIEMVEAVGEEHWPRYFAALRDRLAPGGLAVVQAITIADGRFAAYRRGADFIQRHVFPGGFLPCPSALRAAADCAGLVLDHHEAFGASYARTLAAWRGRFRAAWPAIARMGFDERFRRRWEYYFAYCEAGFRASCIDVGLWRFRRPQDPPSTGPRRTG